VAVVHQARQDGLPQVVLQLLKHALDGATDGGRAGSTLRGENVQQQQQTSGTDFRYNCASKQTLQ
jgi:hypothetical protein